MYASFTSFFRFLRPQDVSRLLKFSKSYTKEASIGQLHEYPPKIFHYLWTVVKSDQTEFPFVSNCFYSLKDRSRQVDSTQFDYLEETNHKLYFSTSSRDLGVQCLLKKTLLWNQRFFCVQRTVVIFSVIIWDDKLLFSISGLPRNFTGTPDALRIRMPFSHVSLLWLASHISLPLPWLRLATRTKYEVTIGPLTKSPQILEYFLGITVIFMSSFHSFLVFD